MALVLKDRVKETTATTGTGTVTLAGAAAGFQSFVVVGDGNQTFYAIVDATSGAWEVGVGTYTASGTTLSRTTVVSSSNAGSLVNFGAGTKDVFVTYPSSRAVYLDAAGSAVTTLDIGTLGTSTANISTANITAGTVANAPVNNTDIVNKQYADAIASGIHFHEAVNLATTAALPANTYNNGTSGVGATLTGNANGALSVDSTLTIASERILVKNEVAGANNGVYTVTQVGSAGTPYILTRATDFDSVGTGVNEIDEGDFFLVTSGTANVNTAWVQQTPPPITIGTTAIVFQQFSAPITYTAGTGLNESPTYTFNIADIGTAGTYGSASSVPVFVTNAQGQVTSVTNTAIAITGAAVSGNISGQAGSVANALTAGTFLTSGGTFDGSAARTFAVDATDANTASKVVARDASGNFAAGTITAALSGNATSSTTSTNLAGGAANQIAFQTGAGATGFVPAPTASGQNVTWDGSSINWAAGPVAGITYLLVSANYTAANREGVLTNTSGGAFTVTLPASPTVGAQVIVADAGANWGVNNLTVGRNGSTIAGLAENLVCNITGVSVQLVYDGTTWEVYAQVGGNGGNTSVSYIFTTTPVTAINKQGVLADTSGGSFTVTLPASPLTGSQVIVADAGANWGTNNLTVGRNGSTIGGLAENLICDISGVSVQFVYDGTTWEVYAQIGGQSGALVTPDGVQTLTNKTIAFGSNTLTDVAGTTATQTLTNKTLTGPTITSSALITASAGLLEYDGKVPYFTPQGLQRGVVPGMQYYRLNSTFVGANASGAQTYLGVGVTLSSNTIYAFQAMIAVSKTAGTTSNNYSLLYGGTATLNNISYFAQFKYNSVFTSVPSSDSYSIFSSTAAASTILSGIATAAGAIALNIRGTVSINAGGTFIPQYSLSAAPGGAWTTQIGSYFCIYPISTSGSNTSVGTWA